MKILLSITFIALLSMTSCHSEFNHAPSISKHELLGRWMMQKVVIEGKDIDQSSFSKRKRWFNFSADGQFQSGGNASGLSYGEWTLDEDAAILHMLTNNNEESDWEISLKNNELEWKSIDNSGQKDFKLILERKEWIKS